MRGQLERFFREMNEWNSPSSQAKERSEKKTPHQPSHDNERAPTRVGGEFTAATWTSSLQRFLSRLRALGLIDPVPSHAARLRAPHFHGRSLALIPRLKHLGLNALVVERNERIGDNWRKRYSALCLHDPVC